VEEEVKRFPLRRIIKNVVPSSFKGAITNLFRIGHVPELLDYWVDERIRIGLEGKPPTAYQDDKALSELQALVKNARTDKKIGFDWERKEFKT
jgi:heterodisulfide reductase subunit C